MPESNPQMMEAVDLALGGDWEAAHRIVQEHEGEPIANWIHAVVHRMEGDRENASYWYQQCGRTLRDEVTTSAELQEIRAALGG
jgi:hypothetical protein